MIRRIMECWLICDWDSVEDNDHSYESEWNANEWRHVEMSIWISSYNSDYMLFVYNQQG